MIKESNYINIQGWMKTQLGLSGNELLAFAIIFGFSQDCESEYSSGVNYLSDWLGCSYPTALSILKKLTDKGFISKREVINEKGRFVNYRVVKNFDNPLLKNLSTPIKNFNTLNISNNINNNICPTSNSGFDRRAITQNEEQNKSESLDSSLAEQKLNEDNELIRKTLHNWNDYLAERYNFPKISCINKTRLSKLKARVKQAGGFKEFWDKLIDAIEDSKFLMNGNDTWKCNFDFVLQESSFLKIIEHQYK